MQSLWRSHPYFTARALPRAAAECRIATMPGVPKLGASEAQRTLVYYTAKSWTMTETILLFCTEADRHTRRCRHSL